MKPADLDKLIERGVRAHRAGRYQDALVSYRKVLRKRPDDAEALSLYGLALVHGGRLKEAAAPLRKAVRLEPDQLGFRLNLLEYRERAHDYQRGLDEARQIIARDPRLARAWEKAGDFALALAQPGEALDAYRQALVLEPDSLPGAVKAARAALALGDPDAARQWRDAAAALGPEHPAVRRLDFDLLAAARDWPALEALGQQRVEADPADTAAWYALSKAEYEQGRYRRSLAAYRKILELTPENAATRTAYARICMHALEFDAAAQALDRAEALDPSMTEMLAAKGMLLTYLGRLTEAEDYTRRSLEQDPAYAPAYTQLVELTHGRLSDGEIQALSTLAVSDHTPVEHRITAGFALGAGRDARGDVDAAFTAYHTANDLARRHHAAEGFVYDPERTAARIDRIISLFPAPGAGPPATPGEPTPIFVVGMPRSGTTLIESALAAHSRVAAGGERSMMQQLLATYLDLPGHETAQPSMDRLTAWRQTYVREFPLPAGADHLTDKQPLNFEALGLIAWLFPEAPIIHVRRDPRETALSIYCHEFSKLWTFAHRLEDIGHYYAQYARLMDHWERTLGPRLRTIQYEEFAGNLNDVVADLLGWCGLGWEPGCASFQTGQRPIATLSAVQARQPVTVRIGKADRYRAHLAGLTAALRGGGVDLQTGALQTL